MNNTSLCEASNGQECERATERYVLPEVSFYPVDEGYMLEADMPGVSREGLEIYVDRNELTVIGHRPKVTPEAVHYRETGVGDYRRVFELDPEIDTEKITARVENGVLTLHLAKREKVKPRPVAITE